MLGHKRENIDFTTLIVKTMKVDFVGTTYIRLHLTPDFSLRHSVSIKELGDTVGNFSIFLLCKTQIINKS